MTDTTKLETTIAQALHDNAPQGLVDFLDAYDIVADVWFMNYANILASHLTRAGFVSVKTVEKMIREQYRPRADYMNPNYSQSDHVFAETVANIIDDIRALTEGSP